MMILELSFVSTGNDVDEVTKSSQNVTITGFTISLEHNFSETAVDRVEMT